MRIAQFEAGATALCLSGGGIRSASFCLGVVQGLARSAACSRASTTCPRYPGGGYIGSMLAAWMYRAAGGAAEVEAALARRASGAKATRSTRCAATSATSRRGRASSRSTRGHWSRPTCATSLLNALIWLPMLALALLGPDARRHDRRRRHAWTIADAGTLRLAARRRQRRERRGASSAAIFTLRNAIARPADAVARRSRRARDVTSAHPAGAVRRRAAAERLDLLARVRRSRRAVAAHHRRGNDACCRCCPCRRAREPPVAARPAVRGAARLPGLRVPQPAARAVRCIASRSWSPARSSAS